MNLRALFFAAFAFAVGLAATTVRAEVEFSGVLSTSGRSLFALNDDPSKPATWRALGQNYGDYSLTSFDAKTDTLTLTKNGTPLLLHLKDAAKVKNARPEVAGTFTVGSGEKAEVLRATLAFDQETVLPLKDGLTWHITPTRMPDGNILFRMVFDRTVQNGDVKTVQKLSSPAVLTQPGKSVKMVIGDLEFGFTPTNPSP